MLHAGLREGNTVFSGRTQDADGMRNEGSAVCVSVLAQSFDVGSQIPEY